MLKAASVAIASETEFLLMKKRSKRGVSVKARTYEQGLTVVTGKTHPRSNTETFLEGSS